MPATKTAVADARALGEAHARLIAVDPFITREQVALSPVALWEKITGLSHAQAELDAGMGYETLIGRDLDAMANAYEAELDIER